MIKDNILMPGSNLSFYHHLPVTILLHATMWSHLIRVELVALLAVVVVVHAFSVLLSLTLGLLLVEPIFSFGLGKLVDFSTSKASKEFFGELVRHGLA